MGIPTALQLYTVRDETAKDFTGTLEKVARMGYRGVEFAGFGDQEAGKLRDLLERLGLVPAGSHVALEKLEKDLDGVISYCAELGNPYVVCPWAPITDEASAKKYAAAFNAFGEKIQAAGLEFCYHNHSHEFARAGADYVIDILYRETDPSLVEMELDTCWVFAAGADPAAYLRKYAGRIPLVHLKDMKNVEAKQFTEVGSGLVNVKAIVAEAEKTGVEWLIVEQDACERPSLESARISLENLTKMGLA